MEVFVASGATLSKPSGAGRAHAQVPLRPESGPPSTAAQLIDAIHVKRTALIGLTLLRIVL